MSQLSHYWYDIVLSEEILDHISQYEPLQDSVKIIYGDIVEIRFVRYPYDGEDLNWPIFGSTITLNNSWINIREHRIHIEPVHQANPNIKHEHELTPDTIIGYEIVSQDNTPRYAFIATIALLIQEYGPDIKLYHVYEFEPITEILTTSTFLDQIYDFINKCWTQDTKSAAKN